MSSGPSSPAGISPPGDRHGGFAVHLTRLAWLAATLTAADEFIWSGLRWRWVPGFIDGQL